MRSTDFPFAVMPQRLQRGGSAEEQRRAKQREALERMLENSGALRRGVSGAFDTIKGYIGSRAARPSTIPGDIRSVGSMMYEAVAEDPSGFAIDALLAPLSGMRDFANVRPHALLCCAHLGVDPIVLGKCLGSVPQDILGSSHRCRPQLM